MNMRPAANSPLVGLLLLLACSRPSEDTGLDEGTTDPATGAETMAGSTAAETSTGPLTETTASIGSGGETSSVTDTSTTGEPTKFCGDGVLDLMEECDDGNENEDDGCNSNCGLDRIVFVTSQLYSGDQITGVDGGDNICRNRAFDGDLADPLHYRAWLSDSQTDARSRIKPGRGRYVRVDGEPLAESWEALLSGTLENELIVTEYNQIYMGLVWTGTKPDGTRATGKDHCGDWTFVDLLDPGNGGFYGDSKDVDGRWTLDSPEAAPCSLEVPIYCVEEALP